MVVRLVVDFEEKETRMWVHVEVNLLSTIQLEGGFRSTKNIAHVLILQNPL